MNNQKIEQLLKREKIYKWEIAERLGLHETSFCRWWRRELSEEQVRSILLAVEDIKLGRLKMQK